jgi:hypothetical protein
MRRVLFVALMMIASPALADDSAALRDQAVRCWNMPAGMTDPFIATFDVDLDYKGDVLDIEVKSWSPQNEAGKQAVLSASRAIERCAPYDTASATIRGVVMDPAVLAAKPIDPFKAD